MVALTRLRILVVTVAFLAGVGAMVAPSIGQDRLASPLMVVGLVFFIFWLVLFIRSRIPD